MVQVKPHWTEKSTFDFMFRIRADFLAQVELRLASGPLSQKDLARRLGITEGAVSLMLNKPGDFKLQTMVKYARALGIKLSIVLYDDNDTTNHYGPIHSDIFRRCWEMNGRPKDFWAFERQEVIPCDEWPG